MQTESSTISSLDIVLDLFRMFLPDSNKVPSSYAKIKAIVGSESNNSLIKETAIICAKCLTDICECGNGNKAILLVFNVQLQLESLMTSYKNIMSAYRDEMLSKPYFMDIHQSHYYREAFEKFPNMFPLSLYTDGGRYTKTGGLEGWPLIGLALDLPPKLRQKYSNIIFFGYWYSKQKPNWEFIFKKLGPSLRFSFDGVNFCVKYLQFIADIPARQSLLSMINVSGYNSCYNCDIRGECIGHLVYPYSDTNARDPRTFVDFIDGVQKESVLSEKLIKFPQGVVIDIMHSVYRGPVEDDIKRLIHGFKRDSTQRFLIKLSPVGVAALDGILTKIKFPNEYQRRKIRSLNSLASWKASELKLFCLYVVPTALAFVGSSESTVVAELVESMVVYSSAIRILTESKITSEMVESASEILKFWASNRQRLWTHKAMTFKAHENLHLPNQVKLHGPLSTHSAFAGESVIGRIGHNITCHNMDVSAKQIAERMALSRTSFVWLEKHGTPRLKNYFNQDYKGSTTRQAVPEEAVGIFLNQKFSRYKLQNFININGFNICPYRNTDSTNCYVAVKTSTGFKAIKIISIVETSPNEIFFCVHPLTTIPYSQIMNPEGILASNPFAYQYCCFFKDDDFIEEDLSLVNIQNFLAKYSGEEEEAKEKLKNAELLRQRLEEEARKKEEAKKIKEEEARKKAEAKKRKDEEAAKKRAETKRIKEEEARKLEAERRALVEAEERRALEEEKERRALEEEINRLEKERLHEEAKLLEEERREARAAEEAIEEAQKLENERRALEEEGERLRFEEENRLKIEAEEHEVKEQVKNADLVHQRREEEARKKEEAKRIKEEEARKKAEAKKRKSEEEAKKRAETKRIKDEEARKKDDARRKMKEEVPWHQRTDDIVESMFDRVATPRPRRTRKVIQPDPDYVEFDEKEAIRIKKEVESKKSQKERKSEPKEEIIIPKISDDTPVSDTSAFNGSFWDF